MNRPFNFYDNSLPPIVIVTQAGREHLLAATLGSLAAHLKNTYIHVICQTLDTAIPRVVDLMFAALRLQNNIIRYRRVSSEMSVGATKAWAFPFVLQDAHGSPWIMGLDDDVLVTREAAEGILQAHAVFQAGDHVASLIFPVFDVTPDRGYPDWSSVPVSGARLWDSRMASPTTQATAQFERWDGTGFCGWYPAGSRFAIARSLMHVPRLQSAGILDFWSTYPKCVRGHDGACSKLFHEHGLTAGLVFKALLYHIGLETPHLDGTTWKSDPEFPHLEVQK